MLAPPLRVGYASDRPGGRLKRSLAAIAALPLVACTPLAKDWPAREDYPILEADTHTEPDADPTHLRVIAWNIKFGAARIDFWFDGWGDRVVMSETEVLGNLENLATVVAEFDPDLLLMEEIEVGSKRSAYVDMVDWFLNDAELGYNYAAYVPNWQVAYVPDHGLGKVDMGNALLSKYPITRNTRIDLGPIEEQDGLTKFFYLDRCILEAEVEIAGETYTVLVNHPDAYASDGTKLRQLQQTFDEAAAIDGNVIVGGDLNAIPPGTIQLTDFADVPVIEDMRGVDVVSYEGQEDTLVPWYEAWNEATETDFGSTRADRLSLDEYVAAATAEEQASYMSHSISKDVHWTQRLDYLFSDLPFTEGWVVQDADDGPASADVGDDTILDPMDLSDHAPVWGVLELP